MSNPSEIEPTISNMTSMLACNVNVKLKLAILREAQKRSGTITDIVEEALKQFFKRAKIDWEKEE